ncbi:hypothetical protein B7Y94_00325 [Candidatus Saccharibacteria bacterium 32-49-12]|nr:MAG: hypothetical protein B7Y94_00325 [Candidatus Saccharibacteria bacterium 32-49-12]
MTNDNHRNQRGFTIIEMMLSMIFISFLLLAIAMIIVHVGNIYNKGMTLKEVNQASRLIESDISRSMRESGSFSMTSNYRPVSGVGGRLCLDKYSYLWNYEAAIQSGNSGVITYASGGSLSGRPIHLVKVPDSSGAYCARSGSSFVLGDVRVADQAEAVELLKGGDKMLSIHRLSLQTNAAGTNSLTGQQLYRLSYTIGTGDIAALNSTRTACRVPSDAAANFNFCSVQQFDLVIRTGNGI